MLAQLHRAVRAAVAVLGIVAMAVQLERTATSGFKAANFFSFFTIQSNLLAVVVLGLAAAYGPGPRPAWFEPLRGAATLYMLITGVVFAVFLAGLQEELQTTIPWVDFVLHRLTPLVLFVDWLVDPPRRRIAWRMAFVWLAYPVAYGAYSLARGAVVDWYPYPFLDVGEHGYGGVLALGVVLLAGMAVAALMIVWLGERGRARRQPSGSGLAA